MIMIYRIIVIAKSSPDLMNSMICYGVAFYIFLHVTINLVGVLGILPLTGVPLPFLSYGGSFALTLSIGLAIVQRISIENYNVVIVTWSMLCVQALIEIYLQNYIFEIVIMFLLLAINVKDVKNVLTSVSVLLKRRNDK